MRWRTYTSVCLLSALRGAFSARPESRELLLASAVLRPEPDKAGSPSPPAPPAAPTPPGPESPESAPAPGPAEAATAPNHTQPAQAAPAPAPAAEPAPAPAEPAPTTPEPEKCDPIPGSQSWRKAKKHSQTCEGKMFSCIRGCRYIVEQDTCDECEGSNVTQISAEKEVDAYLKQNSKFRIPTGVDSYGWGIRGCTKRNSVLCYDQERKKVCCCNLGYNFDFQTRECIADTEDPGNKEEAIPGSQLWGRMKKKGSADKCVKQQSKWCCHRSCTYELDKDKCGRCENYDQKPPTTVAQIVLDWEKANGPYLIPPSIDKPGLFGGCSTKNSKKCVAQHSSTKHCCCDKGFVWSFETRLCAKAAQVQQEQQQEYQEMQSYDQAAASDQSHQGPPPIPPQPPAPEPEEHAETQHAGGNAETKQAATLAAKTAMKASGFSAAAPRSLALLVPMLTFSLLRGHWLV